MEKKSLQEIENFYVSLGYGVGRLRKALDKDKDYQRILKERKQKLTKHFKVTPMENKKYVLSIDTDFDILAKCKQLEKAGLSEEDRLLVEFIKTQLEHDWRKPLLEKLNEIIRRYR